MSITSNKKGFTLIEIVIVLAIAALVLAAVLLAVSGAQKSRRDTQRKNDAGAYAAALEQFASNNGGAYPTPNGTALAATYFDRRDPGSGAVYTIQAGAPAAGQLQYVIGQDCAAVANGRYYALTVGLEQGGSACFSNHQ